MVKFFSDREWREAHEFSSVAPAGLGWTKETLSTTANQGYQVTYALPPHAHAGTAMARLAKASGLGGKIGGNYKAGRSR